MGREDEMKREDAGAWGCICFTIIAIISILVVITMMILMGLGVIEKPSSVYKIYDVENGMVCQIYRHRGGDMECYPMKRE